MHHPSNYIQLVTSQLPNQETPLVNNPDIPVRLRGVGPNLPADGALILDAPGRAAALERVVGGVLAVGPGEEKRHVAVLAAGARSEGSDKVSGFERRPRDRLRNLREAHGAEARGICVERHGDKPRTARIDR